MKNLVIKSEQEVILKKKILNIQNIIHKTIISAQKYKILDIFGPNELNICITSCENLFSQLNVLLEYLHNKSLNNVEISNKANRDYFRVNYNF